MKNPLTKKIVIIFSVIFVVIASAVLVAVLTGNTNTPALSDPNGVFYERLNDDETVKYTITNKELYDEIVGNDGIDQLLYMIDSHLLQDYIAFITLPENNQLIVDKINMLKYGTTDTQKIADFDEETKTTFEASFEQNMILVGYAGNEEAYVIIQLAREAYTRYMLDVDGAVTDMNVASDYVTNYFEDIKAIKIRFYSTSDAIDVMRKFGLLTLSGKLVHYNGYTFTSETLLDSNEAIVEAMKTIDTYYFDDADNILNLDAEIVYTLGTNSIYTDTEGAEYEIDEFGNLINSESSLIVIDATALFETKTAAEDYKTANTFYYTVLKNELDQIIVKDSLDAIIYTIDEEGEIFDADSNNVTDTCGLIVNKLFTEIKNVTTTTVNNSTALSDEEVLYYFIQMYNYVYDDFRDDILETSSAADLIASDNVFLNHNYTATKAIQTNLATYMFSTLDITGEDAVPYSSTYKSFTGSNDTSCYLVYKLTQPTKVDAYKLMLDQIENALIQSIPTVAVADFNLPATGWYDAAITWTSGTTARITVADAKTEVDGKNVYVATVYPSAIAENVTLTYKIIANGVTRNGSVIVSIINSGSTSSVTLPADDQPTFQSILLNDTIYNNLYNALIEAFLTDTTNSAKTINTKLAILRATYNFKIYDYYLGLGYESTLSSLDTNDLYSDFQSEAKGHRTSVGSITGYPVRNGADGVTEDYVVSADMLFTYCVDKNAALYVLYASQFKELIYSEYFEPIFGTETNLLNNNSSRMDEMYESVSSAKTLYTNYKAFYDTYYPSYNFYDSFGKYSFAQYGARNEEELLKYFVEGEIQPYIIDEFLTQYDFLTMIKETVQDYYDNYFSLFVTHMIIYIDRDENGSPDDYDAYLASMSADDKTNVFYPRIADFETQINAYLAENEDNTFTTLISEYNNATRDDATWGRFKQYGFCLMTEDLNTEEEGDDSTTITHSLEYTGDYGVKDTYVPAFVEALSALYDTYHLAQNADKTELYSPLVPTVYGLHLILATKGDYYDQYSAICTTVDASNLLYNTNGMPTDNQMAQYALYFFLKSAYDLTDESVLASLADNGIVVPEIPATLSTALAFYIDDIISEAYVVGTINVQMANRLASGTFFTSDYNEKTSAQLQALLIEVKNTYYNALFGKYNLD
ncbi:MAG: hypothetical protein WC479_06455 [Candidatus Izemoplasmatales bacterium]